MVAEKRVRSKPLIRDRGENNSRKRYHQALAQS